MDTLVLIECIMANSVLQNPVPNPVPSTGAPQVAAAKWPRDGRGFAVGRGTSNGGFDAGLVSRNLGTVARQDGGVGLAQVFADTP
jgi:hypothetical protein